MVKVTVGQLGPRPWSLPLSRPLEQKPSKGKKKKKEQKPSTQQRRGNVFLVALEAGEVLAASVSGEGPPSGLQMATFSLCLHVGGGTRELSGVSFVRHQSHS